MQKILNIRKSITAKQKSLAVTNIYSSSIGTKSQASPSQLGK
jgi:hypothetical protein